MEFSHRSVLLNETVDNLITDPGGIYVDGTVGGGGHSHLICQRLAEGGRLIAFDQDKEAIEAASLRLSSFKDRVTLIRSNYEGMVRELKERGTDSVSGIMLDLGVSSHQIDDPSRGFSYMHDEAPLDMRMDQRNPRTAADILNSYSKEELARILREYGEERYAANIARNIVKKRETEPFKSAGQLNEVIRSSIPAKARASGGHPSKRTFQALRIELNGELDVLERSLDNMIDILKPGGRLCVITFHSLEDRIVKTNLKRNENPCTCPPDFPVCVCGKVSKGKMSPRKPITPSEEEKAQNPRSKSAKLRVFIKRDVPDDKAPGRVGFSNETKNAQALKRIEII